LSGSNHLRVFPGARDRSQAVTGLVHPIASLRARYAPASQAFAASRGDTRWLLFLAAHVPLALALRALPMPYARLPVVVRGRLPHTDMKRLPSMSTPPQSLRCWSYHDGEFQEGPVLGHLQDISPERRRCLAVVICTMDRPRSIRRRHGSAGPQPGAAAPDGRCRSSICPKTFRSRYQRSEVGARVRGGPPPEVIGLTSATSWNPLNRATRGRPRRWRECARGYR